MAEGIDCETNLALYADDTKMWHKITSDLDFNKLQKDIDFLLFMSLIKWQVRLISPYY